MLGVISKMLEKVYGDQVLCYRRVCEWHRPLLQECVVRRSGLGGKVFDCGAGGRWLETALGNKQRS